MYECPNNFFDYFQFFMFYLDYLMIPWTPVTYGKLVFDPGTFFRGRGLEAIYNTL